MGNLALQLVAVTVCALGLWVVSELSGFAGCPVSVRELVSNGTRPLRFVIYFHSQNHSGRQTLLSPSQR